MHKQTCCLLLLALLVLVSGCAAPAASQRAPTASATPVPTLQAASPLVGVESPGVDTVSAAEPAAPSVTVAPSAITAPSATSLPTAPPTATPPLVVPPETLHVMDQLPAMRPAFEGDIDGASLWDQYVIYATLDPDGLTLTGELRLQVTNREQRGWDALYFRLYPNHPDFRGGQLRIDEPVLVAGQPAETSSEQDGVLLRVALPQPLAAGASTTVTLDFTTTTPRNASGSSYGAFNQEVGVWALASFYPVLARRFDGEWDRRPVFGQGDLAVTETALYDVTLDTPPAWSLVTTGVRIGEMPLEHGPRRERFVSGPQRDFFVAALQGLDQASTEVDGTRIVSYYQPDDAAGGQRSLEVAAQALRAFNARFGPYPLAELEVVQAALTRFIGVEYPGVVLIEQELYPRSGRTLDTTVAHEVAHQWWYSLVGNDVQGEPWVDEGLTSYAQVLYYEGIGNRTAAESELEHFRNQYWIVRNAGRDGPVGGNVDSFQGNYFGLVYAKGALFFHALRQQMGDELFFRFLSDYYATYRYDEASGLDLLNTAQASCQCDVQPLYDAWINCTAPVSVP
jgi:hypothetical protein